MKFLLDTNIIVFWLKGRFNIGEKIMDVGAENCFVSEITVAELKFGVACSTPDIIVEKRNRLENFLKHLQIIPISEAIDRFALEKARLRLAGEIIPDFVVNWFGRRPNWFENGDKQRETFVKN